MYNTAVFTHLQ